VELIVELPAGTVSLAGPDDFSRFAVRVHSPARVGEEADDLGAALARTGAGRQLEDGDVAVPPDALRRLARAAAGTDGSPLADEWESAFAAMVAYADAHGWVESDGAIRAHVVRGE
jgi:hypothetical protein